MGEINPPVRVQTARHVFFQELADLPEWAHSPPDVLRELIALQDLYDRASRSAPDHVRKGALNWSLITEPTLIPEEVIDLTHALEDWARRHRISAAWVLEAALHLLRGEGPISYEVTVAGQVDPYPRPGESKIAAKSRILEEVDRMVSQLPDEPHEMPELKRNARWTINHLVLGHTFEEIAEEAGLARRIGGTRDPTRTGKNTVHDAVERFCRLIGLPMKASASRSRKRKRRSVARPRKAGDSRRRQSKT